MVPQKYSVGGEMLYPREVEEKYGIIWHSLYARMDLYGETPDEALDALLHPKKKTAKEPKARKPRAKGRKPWGMMSKAEINRNKKAKCMQCIYRGMWSGGMDMSPSRAYCDYASRTGHSRGGDPRDCEHWKETGKVRPRHRGIEFTLRRNA